MNQINSESGSHLVAASPFPVVSSKRLLILVAVELVVLAALVAFLHGSESAGPQLALIPTLIAVVGAKFFGSKKDKDSVFGDHPAVQFTFKALATGDLDDVDEMVAEDFAAYANGYSVVESSDANGPEEFAENIEYWRAVVPDLSVDIYDEVSQKDPDKTDSIAVRFVFTGTLTASDFERGFEVEGATFIKVVDRKLSEWRVVVDTAFLEELRSAMGHPLA
ncbi:MAG: ester cyclase [Acidimicrobiia bacterium]|nr:ester cyclase [Acidimicrobiia bacterium]